MRYSWWLAVVVLVVTGCREGDGPLAGSGGNSLVVQSDPARGAISVDGRSTGRLTPDTIRGVGGLHEVTVQLDTMGLVYRYSAQVVVTGSEPTVLNGPLMARCQQGVTACTQRYHRNHSFASMQFGSNALGPLFLQSGQGGGLHWPAGSSNSYMSTGTPVFAGIWGDVMLSTGIYDTEFLAGRPAPQVQSGGGRLTLTQTTWILPPVSTQPLPVARGIQIEERVIASSAHEGLLLIELTYRNITNSPLYRIVDPHPEVQQTGITYRDAYIGFALDPDIGAADDDWLSYDEPLSAVFAYDAAFSEGVFSTQQTSPALVGLRVLRVPPGAAPVLNGWVNTPQGGSDWRAATASQRQGYEMLSGLQSYTPDHPGTTIGHLPSAPGDTRIVAAAGPVRLAPGESATAVFAIALAAPVAGSYTSGQVVPAGTPGDASRALHAIAANLRTRLAAAESMLGLLGN